MGDDKCIAKQIYGEVYPWEMASKKIIVKGCKEQDLSFRFRTERGPKGVDKRKTKGKSRSKKMSRIGEE